MKAQMIGVVLVVAGLLGLANAATYYISPTGNDASAGTAALAPWKTFDYAISKLRAGDQLILLDGIYEVSNSGWIYMEGMQGAADAPIMIKAQNERKAWLRGDGSSYCVWLFKCSYIVLEGLRVSSADRVVASGFNPVNVRIDSCNNVSVKRLLVHHNNRYANTALVQFFKSKKCLIEETEIYTYHRHGIVFSNSDSCTARRCYGNSRGCLDIAGGFTSGGEGGDAFIASYPGRFNTVENCISEGQGIGWDGEADYGLTGRPFTSFNRCFGFISLNDFFGICPRSRGLTEDQQPHSNVWTNTAIINSKGAGVYFRGNIDSHFNNSTIYGSAGQGLVADANGTGLTGSGAYSVFAENLIVKGCASNGINLPYAGTSGWSVKLDHTNSQGNLNNFIPATSADYINPTQIDPQLGACRLWIPDNSPMKKAGKDGADIGANILYRYQDGVLTSTPLWDPATGEFPHGAVIPELNGIPGQSLFDVHKRLNVNCNSCPFPSSYPKPGTPAIVLARAGSSPEPAFLSITPNYAGLSVSIKTDVNHPATVEVYNLQGKRVGQIRSTHGNSIQWQRGNLPAGVYFVKASSRGITATARMLLTSK